MVYKLKRGSTYWWEREKENVLEKINESFRTVMLILSILSRSA
jgi:hypothetical protein